MTRFALIGLLSLFFSFCGGGFGDPGMGDGRERFSVFFSEPGRDQDTMIDKKVDDELVRLIDGAERYMYLAVYNFNKTSVVQAVLRAFQRNIDVRVVGDIDEFYTSGYQTMYFNNINMTLGNASGIQHNKFAVVDDRYVFMGTGNISDTDMVRNNNNWYIIENAQLVKLYKDEFLQMHNGLFGAQKRQRSTSTQIVLNNNPFELYFSPYQGDEAMDRIIALVESAQTSIHYMIFAHTHDELDAAMVRMARQRGIPVYGIHDSTFVSGISEEAPKMYSAGFNNDGSMSPTGPFVRWDGNENTSIKNNPAHGGKMHCKTVLIDAGTPNARMATGSFNWSNNAINNNDENVIIVNQARVVNTIYEQWKGAWGIANDMALRVQRRGHTANAGDVLISEVGWAGATDGSNIENGDDFIEIFNNSAAPIDLSHWAIQWGTNDKRNLYPVPDPHNWYYENKNACSGFSEYLTAKPNIICPGQTRIFYNNKPSAFAETGADEIITYNEDGAEIRNTTGGSLTTEHFKFSGTKNFKISGSSFRIRLYDTAMNLIDEAGDGGTAPAGIYSDYTAPKQTFSMERRGYNSVTQRFTAQQSGRLSSAWFTHRSAEPYTCANRQDYSGTAFDGCTTKATNTFSSAGYIYEWETSPVLQRAEATSTSQIRVTFDSDVTSGSGNFNCLASGALIISETEDTGNLCTDTFSVNSLTPVAGNSSQVLINLSTGAMTSPNCRYRITPTALCRDASGRFARPVVYAATANGLSKSTTDGATFVNTISGLGSVTVRAVHAPIQGNVYAATSGGLSISTNDASSFTNKTTADGLGSNDVLCVFASPTRLIAGTAAGLSISTDGGTTFANRTTANGLGSNNIQGIFVAGNNVYAATSNGISISTNGGSSFLNSLAGVSVNSVFAMGNFVVIGSNSGLYISTNGGVSFGSAKTTADGLGSNTVRSVIISDGAIYAATSNGVSVSINGGNTFNNSTSGLGGNDVRSLSVSGTTVYAATSNGISISINNGTSFTNAIAGLGSSNTNGIFASGSTSTIHFSGYSAALASVIINEVCVTDCPTGTFNSKDWVELKVKPSGAGSLRGLKLYYYDESEFRLVYEFSDVYAPNNALIAVGLAQAAESRPDRNGATVAYPMAITLRDTAAFGATDGTFILTYCATGENDTVDTAQPGCALPYKGIQDALYYSNRDGTLTQPMVAGPLNHFYSNLQSFWPISERPVFGLNDRNTQLTGSCIAADSSSTENSTYLCTNSGAGIARSSADTGAVRNAGKTGWRNYTRTAMTPNAANATW